MTEQIDESMALIERRSSSEIGPETRRFITPEIQDIWAAFSLGYPLHMSISEGEVAAFCGECDSRRKEDGICFSGENDQSRYAARKWCGYAMVNGVRGQMTKEGFKAWEDKKLIS